MSEAGKTPPPQNATDEQILEESRRHTRRSFAVAAVATAAAYGVYRWIDGSVDIGRQNAPLRRAFEANASISRGVFKERGLAPTFPVSRSSPLRLNGNIGMEQDLVPDSYRLQMAGVANASQHPRYSKDVTAWDYRYSDADEKKEDDHDVKSAPKAATEGASGQPKNQPSAKPSTDDQSGSSGDATVTVEQRFKFEAQQASHKRRQGDAEAGPSASSLDIGTPGLLLTMDDVRKLPRHEFVTEFKCIEGWSQVVHWGGVRLVDLIEAYPPEKINGREPRFVYMETPDGNYYGGYNMSACRHPQSLLVTEMAGQPLSPDHGAPLRLHMPIKYGYKQLKRIGLIAYMDTKPDDYWTKLGYDWYAGL